MSKAVQSKAKKSSPYDLGKSKCPYDWPSSRGNGSSAKFALEHEVRHAAREEGVAVRWFMLLLQLHYNPRKKQAPFSEKTPPNLSNELLEMIYAVYGKLTLADLLKRKQRFMKVESVRDLGVYHEGQIPDYSDKLRLGFPKIGADVSGYQYDTAHDRNKFEDGKMSFRVTERVEPGKYVHWTVSVDLKQVILDCTNYQEQEQMTIPDEAVTVETNVREHRSLLGLGQDEVAALEQFQLKMKFTWGGSYIECVPVDAEQAKVNGAVGSKLHVSCPWVLGISLDEHDGVKVGDRVQIKEPFKMYRHFALHAIDTVVEVHMFKQAFYYLDLEDPRVVKQVELAHKNGRGLQDGQPPHLLASRKFQLEPVGVKLDEYDGLKVGDRVRFTGTFTLYHSFAVGQEGVVREIRMFRNSVYYVELVDPALAVQVEGAHACGNMLKYGQLPHQLAAARSHLASV